MEIRTVFKSTWFWVIVVGIVVLVCVIAIPSVPLTILDTLAGKTQGDSSEDKAEQSGAELIEANGNQGLRLSPDAISGFEINPVKAVAATKDRALPPQIG